ncbi:universal stress protein [Halobellus salinus]|uniref:Universal stress protein n=1 Tax=Halobellus salinus TaxID=931585 RepID=A0A830EI95_9EURY|nr:universal stress protein [Halobellus salinus]GGJ07644.1 universal stress protein [Halobellus salinus]SMP26375.1 Universal stress protein family protein [Halobellus salinus]
MRESAPTVLVPVDVSGDERPDPDLLALLRPAKVVLVGWYPVPDQTALEQMQAEHEEAAVARIEDVAAEFPEDTDVETLVVFTRDRTETVDRVADDYGAAVVVIPEEVRVVERVLVPVRGDVNLDRVLSVVAALLHESEASVTLFHAAPAGDEDPSVGTTLLSGAADRLADAGIDDNRIDTVAVESDTPIDDIVDAATNHDVLVLGESEPSLVAQILGDAPSRIIRESGRPVLVVRDVE